MLFKFLFVLFLFIVFIYYLPLVETYSNKSVSVYNFGAPGSSPANNYKDISYQVQYTCRPSTTGMFTDCGPLGFNIYEYSDTRGCNVPEKCLQQTKVK